MGPSQDTSSLATTEPAMAVNDVACQAAMTALSIGSLFLFRLLRRVQATPGALFEAAFAPLFITRGLIPATTATSVEKADDEPHTTCHSRHDTEQRLDGAHRERLLQAGSPFRAAH